MCILTRYFSHLLLTQIQELGLQKAYSEHDGAYKYLRKLMALPFLPHHEIPSMFAFLSEQVQGPPLSDLIDYIRKQWIESRTLPPRNWSIYQQSIRTNNDIEGWHNALNRRAGGGSNLPLYLLIELLHREAQLTTINIRLVSERKLKRIQRKTYRKQQEQIFKQWEMYEKKEKTSAELLRFCSHINEPVRG